MRSSSLIALTVAGSLLGACRNVERPIDRIAAMEREIISSERHKADWRPFFDAVMPRREYLCGPAFDCVNGDERGVYEPDLLPRISDRTSLVTHPRDAGPLQALVDLARQLRTRNVDFLVVLVPAKTTLYPELMATPPASAGVGGRPDWDLRRLMLALEREGIEVLDLFEPLSAGRDRTLLDDQGRPFVERIYRTQDIHWTSHAASLAADAIAARVRRYPWFPALAHESGRAVTYELLTWVVEHGYFAEVERQKRTDGSTAFTVPPEKYALHQIFVSGERVSPASLTDGTSPVLLIGDSFAHEYSRDGRRAGLPEHLLRALGFRVDMIAMGHGSPYTARAAMAMTRPGVTGKKLVIHEMHAVAPYYWDEWKLVDIGGTDGGVTP